MKTRSWIMLGAAVLIVGAVLVVALLTTTSFDTVLEFSVKDINSEEWVYDADIRLQNRLIRGYFDTKYRFTHLDPGDAVLKITAPSYDPVEIAVKLKRGKNVLEEPDAMVGLEIPDLSHFIIMEDVEEGHLVSEVRPVGTNGQAVVNHPSLGIRIFARITAQMLDGAYSYEPSDAGAERGEELFTGALTTEWDASPGTVFRWTTRLPLEKIKKSKALYWVVDYLLLIPNPKQIEKQELDSLVKELPEKTTPEALKAYLDTFEGKLDYYFFPSWNVAAGG